MYLIFALISIFSTCTAAATTIYYVNDGDLAYTWIDITGDQRMEWISVEKVLPPIGTFVLTYDPEMEWFSSQIPKLNCEMYSRIDGDTYFCSSGDIIINKSITHWMPLPAPTAFKDGND